MEFKTNHIFKSNIGFSLIEVLISIVLLSLLMVYVLTIVNDSSITKEEVTLEDAEYIQVETAISRITTDLEQIYSPAYFSAPMDPRKLENRENDPSLASGFERSERYPEVTYRGHPIPLMDNPDKQSFTFLASVNRRKVEDSKQADFAWVRYALEDTDDENKNIEAPYELVRFYNPNNLYFTENDWEDIKPQLLLKNVKKLEFGFWQSSRKKFVESLKELNEESQTPRLFQIKLTWIDKANIEHEEIRTFRPLWPVFDAKTEQQEMDKITKAAPNAGTSENSPNEIIREETPESEGPNDE